MTKPPTDWEAIEREYRAGILSIREIAKGHGVSDTAIRKQAKLGNWQRDLTEKVRSQAKAKVVRELGSQGGSHEQRVRTEAEIVEAAADIQVSVVRSHRRDLSQLNAIAVILAERLAQHLDGVTSELPGIGLRETPADMLEKLTRTRSKVIQLERQAFNLDASPDNDDGAAPIGSGALERLAAKLDRSREAVPAGEPDGRGG